jgi:hypothetical protein
MNVEIGAEAALFPEKEYLNEIAVAVRGGGGNPQSPFPGQDIDSQKYRTISNTSFLTNFRIGYDE